MTTNNDVLFADSNYTHTFAHFMLTHTAPVSNNTIHLQSLFALIPRIEAKYQFRKMKRDELEAAAAPEGAWKELKVLERYNATAFISWDSVADEIRGIMGKLMFDNDLPYNDLHLVIANLWDICEIDRYRSGYLAARLDNGEVLIMLKKINFLRDVDFT